MTRTSIGVLAGMMALLTACAPASHHPQAPTPNRPMDSLADEVRTRRAALIDAVRLPDTALLRRHLAPNAILVRPAGDTVRGATAIARDLLALRAAKPIETVRGIPMRGMIRCFNGILEPVGEWSLAITGRDSSLEFLRGTVSIQWVAKGDSLVVGMVDFSQRVLQTDQSGCVSVDAVRYAVRRLEAFYTFGFLSPTSFYKSANRTLAAAGYVNMNSIDQANFPNGNRPGVTQLVGVSGRLMDHAWLTVSGPRSPELSSLGRCNVETYNYVYMERERRAWSVTLDARAHGVSVGAGPAFTSDRFHYRELDFFARPPDQSYSRCGSAAVLRTHDSSTTSRRSTGVAGNISYLMEAGPHAAVMARAQVLRFSAAGAPSTSRGMSLVFRDVTTMLGLGFVFTY